MKLLLLLGLSVAVVYGYYSRIATFILKLLASILHYQPLGNDRMEPFGFQARILAAEEETLQGGSLFIQLLGVQALKLSDNGFKILHPKLPLVSVQKILYLSQTDLGYTNMEAVNCRLRNRPRRDPCPMR